MAVLGAVLAPMAGAAPATANHGSAFGPDNLEQTVREQGLTTGGNWASDWGQLVLDNTEYVLSSGSWIDIRVADFPSGNDGFNGRTNFDLATCVSSPRGLDCDVIDISFNLSYSHSKGAWKSIGCHEFGHSMSLLDRRSVPNTCMTTPRYGDSPPAALDAHDTATVNGRF
jgi:hypothetical protein